VRWKEILFERLKRVCPFNEIVPMIDLHFATLDKTFSRLQSGAQPATAALKSWARS
jgi:hypothetical protein